MPSHFRLKLLVAAIGMAAAGSVCAATTASTSSFVALTQNAPALHPGDVVSGSLDVSQPIHIEVALKLRNPDQLHTFIKTAKTSSLGMVRHKLSNAEFAASYSPTADQANQVAAYLTSAGFTNVVIAPNRLMVSADGRADTAQAAFKTHFAKVRTHEGRMAYMNNSAVHIPAALKGSVLSVIGLQDVHRAHTFAQPVQAAYSTQAITGHNPTEFASIYGASGLPTAAGVTIGIVTQGKITQTVTDLNTFTSQNGLSTVTTQTVNTNGTSTDTSGVGEWNLDSQDIVGMAGGKVGKLIFYNIPTLSNANLTADFNTIVSANATKIINVSLGECETYAQQDGSAAADDQIFQQAIAQGQTFSISTGDSGADECGDGGTTPSYPSSSPYVVAVGGTTLNASTTTYTSETVWSSGGGSISKFEAKPSWQSSVLSGNFRGLPDISFDADPNSGSKIILNGSTAQYGGTSLAAPLFAGAWARLLASNSAAGLRRADVLPDAHRGGLSRRHFRQQRRRDRQRRLGPGHRLRQPEDGSGGRPHRRRWWQQQRAAGRQLQRHGERPGGELHRQLQRQRRQHRLARVELRRRQHLDRHQPQPHLQRRRHLHGIADGYRQQRRDQHQDPVGDGLRRWRRWWQRAAERCGHHRPVRRTGCPAGLYGGHPGRCHQSGDLRVRRYR